MFGNLFNRNRGKAQNSQAQNSPQFYLDTMRDMLAQIIRNHPNTFESSLPYDISPYYNQPWRIGVTFVFRSAAIRQQVQANGTTAQIERELQAAIAGTNARMGDNHHIELFNAVQWTDMETINAAGGPRNVF